MSAGSDMKAVERWFVRRGLPHFIEDYSATNDIWTRAAGVLTFVFLIEMFAALNFDTALANTLAVFGAFAFLVGIWALINRWRGRAPLARPSSIGAVELAVFVLVPPLVPAIFGGNLAGAVGLIASNLVFLLVIFYFTSYAVIPILIWATGRLSRQLGDTIRLFARALPLLLLFVTFLFINAEVWQLASGLFGPLFAGTLVLFAGAGALFAVVRLPQEVKGVGTFATWDDVDASCPSRAPIEELAASRIAAEPPFVALTRRQWVNVGLVILFGQALQVALVAVLVGAFLVLLGLLTMPPDVIVAWTQDASVNTLVTLRMLGREVTLTEELLRVASFLAAFSGLYFAVTAVTDPGYREEFFEEVIGEVREGFAVRALYLDALHQPDAAWRAHRHVPGGTGLPPQT